MPQLLAHHSTLHLERQFSDLDVDQSAHPSRMYHSEHKGLVPKIRALMLHRLFIVLSAHPDSRSCLQGCRLSPGSRTTSRCNDGPVLGCCCISDSVMRLLPAALVHENSLFGEFVACCCTGAANHLAVTITRRQWLSWSRTAKPCCWVPLFMTFSSCQADIEAAKSS